MILLVGIGAGLAILLFIIIGGLYRLMGGTHKKPLK
ncbi:hypothetical protein Sulac_0191 [Sulfobacillus acidophilus DSM 10332]|uniref:Uncharacterized protein n=1 Tax=Sulfobacillus acidophilus (strain ATCC 700253 / DSM 10332 / NAL) TaxID=679936 RepID=G8TWC0_SULAD|nr:hypothetical protein Sulac_0191 [Sulfobacillus acidophilus DSM 10332]